MVRNIKNFLHFLNACVATLFYGYPARKMTVVGITGTDGKTTTAHLLYHILKETGKKVTLISSVAAYIGKKEYDTGFHVTTPSPWDLQKLLSKAQREGCKIAVLEVTSHALDQYRTVGSSIDIGIITNVSHEHIDYHKTFANYLSAKAKILRGIKVGIINRDDKNYEFLASRARSKVLTFSLRLNADYTPKKVKLRSKLLGDFNRYNALAAAAAASYLKIQKKTIERGISKFGGVNGRMEFVQTNKPFTIIIDFAHKLNALENALRSVRAITKGKVIVVFGCAGLRDSIKRPLMGKIAGTLADIVVLTAEDPRTEDVRKIIDQIAQGFKGLSVVEGDRHNVNLKMLRKGKYYFKIPDRQESINFAIRNLAKAGDTILLCGKGHEKSMCWGKIEYPWDEHKAVEKALYGTVKAA